MALLTVFEKRNVRPRIRSSPQNIVATKQFLEGNEMNTKRTINLTLTFSCMFVVTAGFLAFGAVAAPAQDSVTGLNVSEVRFGNYGQLTGILRETRDGSWELLDPDMSRKSLYPDGSVFTGNDEYWRFRETGRDKSAVYLTQTMYRYGTTTITINLAKRDVTYTAGGNTKRLGSIISAEGIARESSYPPATPGETDVTGMNLREVQFRNSAGRSVSLKQNSDDTWEMYEQGEDFINLLTERARDKSSVDLADSSSGEIVTIDLRLWQVTSTRNGGTRLGRISRVEGGSSSVSLNPPTAPRPPRPPKPPMPPKVSPNPPYIYEPLDRAVNGWNVSEVQFGQPPGEIIGMFIQSGYKRWDRLDADGSVAASFSETGRDESTVRLTDSSRKSYVTLDLRQREVVERSTAGVAVWGNVIRASSASVGPGVSGGMSITFVNRTNRQIEVYRVNQGSVSNYNELDSSDAMSQPTMASYRWRIRSNGKLIGTYVATSALSQIVEVTTETVWAGKIRDQREAEKKCEKEARARGGYWTGNWDWSGSGSNAGCELLRIN